MHTQSVAWSIESSSSPTQEMMVTKSKNDIDQNIQEGTHELQKLKASLPPKSNSSNDKIQPQIIAKEDEKQEFIEQKPQTIDPKQTIPTFKQLSTYKVITMEYC